MTLALEIAFAAGFAVVAASLAAVAFRSVPVRLLLGSAVALAVLALAAAVVAGIEIAEGSAEEELLIVTAGGLLLAAACQTALFALTRGLDRVRDLEAVADRARAEIDRYLDEHAAERKL
ncbi:MAG TPA: hypothetical protein VD704_08360, partial [Gaiellaceae bacterium]|nr:hypothetical protein [Gaiellaceae bacterium]